MMDGLRMPDQRPTKLTKSQLRTQQLIGSLKFIEHLHPHLSLVLHRLSCVMACPPPEAYLVAQLALCDAYDERDVGITFGGGGLSNASRLTGALYGHIDLTEPSAAGLEAHADATWGDRNLYGQLLTYAGGAILHQTKKIALIVDSSMESEAIASSKSGEHVSYAREILRALGVPPDGPTAVSTDNLSNLKVATGVGCPSRSLHFFRRYSVLRQRIAAGEVHLVHVPDVDQPADFLTKWLANREKVERSVAYATNRRACVNDSQSES